MAAIATTGLVQHDGDMTAGDDDDRAVSEQWTNNDPKGSMVEHR
jgi:hypothetical protein